MGKRIVLQADFFDRAILSVGRDLLGKYLVRRWRGKECAFMITEVEAYDGFRDKASHAAKGMTTRNRVMYGKPGVWYVYFVYGMYDMLNIVTREKGYPAAILIRGVEGVSGPGRLTRTLHVGRSMNNKPASNASGLWIEDRGSHIARNKIARSPRIGVAYAGEEWAGKLWRFSLSK